MASSREIAVFFTMLAASSCGSPAPPSAPVAAKTAWASLAERPCPGDNALDYEGFGGPFVLTWCTGCHSAIFPDGERQGAPAGIDFDTIEGIRAHADRMWARAADQNHTMPPVGGPADSLRSDLGQWLACGAP